jgi:asparagine synthase (glutamine-hydrolysing)
MSVQFGKWNFAGTPMPPDYADTIDTTLRSYSPDGCCCFSGPGIIMFYGAFHTTRESRLEKQPHIISESGAVITWDGRLDNRMELLEHLRSPLTHTATDVAIVASAYERWGTECLAHLVGDWALTVWNPSTQTLTLAKDFAGTRHLFYSFDQNHVAWSTVLDPLVLSAGKMFALDEEYIAGWFSFFPAAHLSPYEGIHAVPPSSYVLLRASDCVIKKYWDFDPNKRIFYPTDDEYEKHFRDVFATAVRRRLRSDVPILAELSGGMDSTSIVCMADTLIAGELTEAPRVDTVSYYNNSDPDWNERPYFTRIEALRGRAGCHIEVGKEESVDSEIESNTFAATPSTGGTTSEASRKFTSYLVSHGSRVVLSGTGGDEVTGGVPTPTPELMDLLRAGRFKPLAHQLKVWALNKRRPWFHLLLEALRGFFPASIVGVPKYMVPARWLRPSFVRQQQVALTGYPSRVRVVGPRPSFQENLSTLDVLRRQIACSSLPAAPSYEIRYPYLDRTLLEFLYAIPRGQLLRPGERRSLMRRALAGIVPSDILQRKRKAFAARSPTKMILREWTSLMRKQDRLVSSDFGIVDAVAFHEEVKNARRGQEVHTVAMMRAMLVENWLRTVTSRGLLKNTFRTVDDARAEKGKYRKDSEHEFS